ncbi:hypothetical protein [Arenimonas aestuarii]
MALSKELREKLIREVGDCLVDRLIPVRMLDWRERLADMDDGELQRCWMETAEFRLNPNESTDFLEEGITPAERHARLRLFAYSTQVNPLREMFVEMAEKLFAQAQLIDSADDLAAASKDLSILLAKRVKAMHERITDEPKKRGRLGGEKAGAHWKAVAEEAVRLADERGLASGQYSADYVAGEIENDVRAFARLRGRDFPGDSATRKIAQYLRDAGIKKKKSTR